MLSDQQQYRYMTVDDMKSLGDDSVKIDVTRDEHDFSRDSLGKFILHLNTQIKMWFVVFNFFFNMTGPHGELAHRRDNILLNSSQPDNVDIVRTPVHVG